MSFAYSLTSFLGASWPKLDARKNNEHFYITVYRQDTKSILKQKLFNKEWSIVSNGKLLVTLVHVCVNYKYPIWHLLLK